MPDNIFTLLVFIPFAAGTIGLYIYRKSRER